MRKKHPCERKTSIGYRPQVPRPGPGIEPATKIHAQYWNGTQELQSMGLPLSTETNPVGHLYFLI